MISVEELKAKVASRYEHTLKELLLGQDPFPVFIPYRRPKRTGDPSEIIALKQLLRSQSKETLGFGPVVEFETAVTRRYGVATLPGNIWFACLDDLARYIGRKAEADRLLDHASIVTSEFPAARKWTATRLQLLSGGTRQDWLAIVKVVSHFIRHIKPWVYPRELQLGLHTKFLEQNHKPIIEILAQVAPEALNEPYTTWQDRLGLRSSSSLVEGRFLDPALAPQLPQHMLAPVDEWNRLAFVRPTWVLIAENRTTLLTLPNLPGCLALLGKGYAVTRLAQIEKLHATQAYYWGDIDQHGFEILASLRNCLPHVLSCLMDEGTLESCHKRVGNESVEATLPYDFVAAHLNTTEKMLWDKLAQGHLRLEQEHIPSDISTLHLEIIAATARRSVATG